MKACFPTLWVLSLGGGVAAAKQERVVFNRDVRPIPEDVMPPVKAHKEL